MTLADGRVLYEASSDGALRSVALPAVVRWSRSGLIVVSVDGSWRYRVLFVPNG